MGYMEGIVYANAGLGHGIDGKKLSILCKVCTALRIWDKWRVMMYIIT